MAQLGHTTAKAQDERIAELEIEVARLRSIEHALERAAAHAQRVASRLQSILNTTVDAVITIGGRGVIETVNPATLSMFGYSEAEMVGENIRMLMPEPDQAKHDSYLAAYGGGAPPKMIGIGRTTNALRKDGTVFPIDLSVSEASVDGLPVYTGIIRDVTKREEAINQLSESEELLRSVFVTAPIGLFISSDERSITRANPALLAMLGRTEEEILGNDCLILEHPAMSSRPEHGTSCSNSRQ